MLGSLILCATTIDIEGYNVANQLVSDGTNTLTYDDNGNLTSDGVNIYTWDRANRLLSMGGVSNQYDGEGHRIQKTVGVDVTKYLLDLQPGLSVALSATKNGDITRFVHTPVGIHAQEDQNGIWTWAVQDGLGSVRLEANNALSVLGMRHLDPFGNPFGAQGTMTLPFVFTGEIRDENGLQNHRARQYSSQVGIFPSLDPFEGLMDRPMSLNGYAWVEGNMPNAVDPSGKATSCECECFEQIPEIAEYQSMGIKRRYDRCMKDCLTRVFAQLTALNPTSACSYIDTENRIAYGCQYNRVSAVVHAWFYRDDNLSAFAGLNIGASTDCTNFASQVLLAGGFLLTDNWHYSRWSERPDGTVVHSNEGYLGLKTPETWKTVNHFMAWLINERFSTSLQPETDITPHASYQRSGGTNMQDRDAVVEAAKGAATQLDRGDIIGYYNPSVDTPYDHVAIVVGWGCPYDYQLKTNLCLDGRTTSIQNVESEYKDGLVPWIVDHGAPRDYEDRLRPYNRQDGYGNIPVDLLFIHIPDIFDISNVLTGEELYSRIK